MTTCAGNSNRYSTCLKHPMRSPAFSLLDLQAFSERQCRWSCLRLLQEPRSQKPHLSAKRRSDKYPLEGKDCQRADDLHRTSASVCPVPPSRPSLGKQVCAISMDASPITSGVSPLQHNTVRERKLGSVDRRPQMRRDGDFQH